MRKINFFLLSFQCIILSMQAQVKVEHLRTENLNSPLGIDVLQPYFSWQLVSNERNVAQSAYEIRVGNEETALAKGKNTWASGKINSNQSIHVPYNGAALASGKKYYWQKHPGR